MARKHSFSRLLAFFLLLALLICSLCSLPLSAASEGITLEQYVATTNLSLRAALNQKAAALQAEGDAATASLLRGFSFHAHRVAIIDVYYSQVYVGTHRSAAELATEMIDFLVENFYLDKLTSPELVTDALVLCYVHTVGDKYASYDADVTVGSEETEYVGIGVTVEPLANGYAKVIEVANGSPAEEAGLRLGDVLVAVEGEDFAALGYDNAISKIRGTEGTAVTVTVERDGNRRDFTMIRKKMTIRSVSFHAVEESEEKIGYIRITKFDGTTFSQFVKAVETLESQEVTSFIFDVRQNPGGRLDVIIAILEYLLPDDTGAPIVRLKYKYETEKINSILDYFYDKDIAANYGHDFAIRYRDALMEECGYNTALNHSVDKKMTVLCDAYTVSAAELFTSCLKDFGVAEVFGSTTYGKGMGQSEITIPFTYAGGLSGNNDPVACIRISTFYYSPPVSQNYEGIGVVPHHAVTLPDELLNVSISDLTYETDEALKAAVAFIESGAPLTEGKVDLTPDNDNTEDGNTDGGNTDSGNTDSGNTDSGNTDGGNTDSGNTDSGNTDGGNTDGGNTDSGNTDSGNTDSGNTDSGNTDSGKPSAPTPPSSKPSTDEPKGETHGAAYILSFWIVFCVLAATAAALFAVGMQKRYGKAKNAPLPSQDTAPTLEDKTSGEASAQASSTDTPTDTPELQ